VGVTVRERLSGEGEACADGDGEFSVSWRTSRKTWLASALIFGMAIGGYTRSG
jgi:hypothetical protein